MMLTVYISSSYHPIASNFSLVQNVFKKIGKLLWESSFKSEVYLIQELAIIFNLSVSLLMLNIFE
jgi:hypothetical protein